MSSIPLSTRGKSNLLKIAMDETMKVAALRRSLPEN